MENDGMEVEEQQNELNCPKLSIINFSKSMKAELLQTDETVVSTQTAMEPSTEDPTQSRKKGIHFVLAFAALAIIAFTNALDDTILGSALPVIAADLQLTSLESFWAAISMLLSSVIFQPIHTALSDIFGRKAILYVCILFFVAGSAIVGSANNAAALIAGRTIQGVGGGGLGALAEIILTDLTTLKERPLYLGVFGFLWGGGSLLAPIVGGLFSEYVSWRWIAWINLPLMGIALILIPLFLNLKEDHSSVQSKLKRVDWISILLILVGLTSFTLALCWGGQLFAWKSWETIFPLVFGICVLVVLAFYERIPEEPIFSHRLFANRTSCISFLSAFLRGLVLWCLVYYLVIYFQGAMQHEPVQASVDIFPLTFTLTPAAIISALLISYTRKYLWVVWFGWLACTLGFGTMVLLNSDISKGVYSAVQLAPGIGIGFVLSGSAVSLQASMRIDDVGLAQGTQVFFRSVGGVIGVSMGSAIFTNKFASQLKTIHLPPDVVLPDASGAIAFLSSIKRLDLAADVTAQVLQIYAESIKMIWVVMACLSAVALLTSLFMKEFTLETEETGKQAFQSGSRMDTKEE